MMFGRFGDVVSLQLNLSLRLQLSVLIRVVLIGFPMNPRPEWLRIYLFLHINGFILKC
jgi:hypothetical protein